MTDREEKLARAREYNRKMIAEEAAAKGMSIDEYRQYRQSVADAYKVSTVAERNRMLKFADKGLSIKEYEQCVRDRIEIKKSKVCKKILSSEFENAVKYARSPETVKKRKEAREAERADNRAKRQARIAKDFEKRLTTRKLRMNGEYDIDAIKASCE
jgi:hypothetical protein